MVYPVTDFEPTGIIQANKIFPQIRFLQEKFNIRDYTGEDVDSAYVITPSAGKDGNKIKIKKYNVRTKIVCNNNSLHHIELDDNDHDKNYFSELRPNHLPPMFERNFNKTTYPRTRNIVGLYADSNFGTSRITGTSDKTRDRPNYLFEVLNPYFTSLSGGILQPSPFWNNIFDYSIYNLNNETEFIAVHGIQSNRFNENNCRFTESTEKYPYPDTDPASIYKISLKKEQRQGGFDNIHLHGYLGHYSDNNQPVIHAPICGYCCFHMHWRWSALNSELGDSLALTLGNKRTTKTIGEYFKGWSIDSNDILSQRPSSGPGMPLIPYEQQLKIAITNPDAIPLNEDSSVTPTNISLLDHERKAVWYCVDIINTEEGANLGHLVMEQGCGYAFDYSEAGKRTVTTLRRCIPNLFRQICEEELGIEDEIFLNYLYESNILIPTTKLKVNELFEIQYRLMRLFNTSIPNIPPGRNFFNQIPAINDNPEPEDNNTRDYLETIINSMINQ